MVNVNSSAQDHITGSNDDSVYRSMTKIQFDKLVDSCIIILKTKSLKKISDQQHIDIMMCLNTIFMTHDKNTFERRFKGGRYDGLEGMSVTVDYTENIIKIYPDWVPDRGMGFYFLKLKMELYGTPHLRSLINVSD